MAWLSIPNDEAAFYATIKYAMSFHGEVSYAKKVYAENSDDFLRFALAFPRQGYLLDQLHRIYKGMDETLQLIWDMHKPNNDIHVGEREIAVTVPNLFETNPFCYFLSPAVTSKHRSSYIALNCALRGGMFQSNRRSSRRRYESCDYYNSTKQPTLAWYREVSQELIDTTYMEQRQSIVKELLSPESTAPFEDGKLPGGTFWRVRRAIVKMEDSFERSMTRLEWAMRDISPIDDESEDEVVRRPRYRDDVLNLDDITGPRKRKERERELLVNRDTHPKPVVVQVEPVVERFEPLVDDAEPIVEAPQPTAEKMIDSDDEDKWSEVPTKEDAPPPSKPAKKQCYTLCS